MDWRLKLGLALAVATVHLIALQVMGAAWQPPARMAAMTAPLFTRELRAATPPPPPPPSPRAASKRPFGQVQSALNAIEKEANPLPLPSTPESSSTTQAPVPPLGGATALPQAAGGTDAEPSEAGGPATAVNAEAHPAPANPQLAAKPVPVNLPPDSWPTDTRLSYRLLGHYRGPISGDARVQWQRDGGRYQVRVELDLGNVTIYSMTSQGVATPLGLEPSLYEEKRLGSKPVHIAMEATQLKLQDGARVDRPGGVQDTASQFVELGHQFATGKASLDVGKSVQLWLARPNAVAEWTYDIVGLETLQSQRLGAVPAYHLKPRPLAKPSGPVTAEMWFAPSLQYLPVRIKITLNAETWVDLHIEKIEQATPPKATPP